MSRRFAIRARTEFRARWEMRGALDAYWVGWQGPVACISCGLPSEGLRVLDERASFLAVGLCSRCSCAASQPTLERLVAWALRRRTIVITDLTFTLRSEAA